MPNATLGKPMTFYRRNLPHWHPEGKVIFATWRLYGSLPKGHLRGMVSGTGTLAGAFASRTAKSGCATTKGQDW